MNLETLAKRYAMFWSTYLAAVRQIDSISDSMGETARQLGFPCPSDRFTDPAKDLQTTRLILFGLLIHAASAEFGSCGQPIRIDPYDFHDYLPPAENDGCELAFDPVGLAERLTDCYGGATGAAQALREIATGLIRFFWIEQDAPIAVKRGGIALDARVWIDTAFKHKGCARLEHGAGETLKAGLRFLSHFAQWAGSELTSSALKEWERSLSYPIEVTSRQTFGLAEISVVTYLSRFEFFFSPALSNQLQVFLGLYGGFNDEVT